MQGCFERLFAQHGLPKAIRSDNGVPFATPNGLLGLSQLSVWWLALGIDLERSRPGCPQDNGGHERLHRDIRGNSTVSTMRNARRPSKLGGESLMRAIAPGPWHARARRALPTLHAQVEGTP